MEQNRDVKESPDRWHRRLLNAARPHGRFAVISSSATAGTVLVLAGIVFASQGSNDSSNISAPTGSVVSSATNDAGVPASSPVTGATSTTVGNESNLQTTTIPENGAQGTLPTNTTVAGTPTTATPGSTTPTTVPSTTSPTTVANATTTTTSRIRSTNGPLIPDLDVNLTSYADDPELRLKISSEDKDGYITRIVINWGENDQTDWEVWNNPTACTEPLGSLFAPPTITHKYTEAKTYTVTVTVTSANCQGEGEQQSMFTRQVTVGGSVATTAPTTTVAP
jgi:hypothetical protein